MGKALAERSGWIQEKLSSPLSGFDPQLDEQRKSSAARLWIMGINGANPRSFSGAPEVKLLASTGEGNKPQFPTPYILQQTLY